MAEKVAQVTRIDEVAPGVLLVAARAVEPPSFAWRAGQFLSIRCGAGGEVRRSYSIVSSPARSDAFELLVKLLAGGVGSTTFRELRVGDELRFTGPMGFFVADFAHTGDALFVATGAGIAAVLPMIEEIVARGERAELLWGMRRPEELYLRDRLEGLAGERFRWQLCYSRPPAAWTGLTGHVQEHVVPRPGAVYYLCGHGDMIRDVKAKLEAAGVDRKKQIRTEVFYPATKR